MSTSTLLRQCMHELEAAYDQAMAEHGHDSAQAKLIADAVTWMRDWMRSYAQYIRNE